MPEARWSIRGIELALRYTAVTRLDLEQARLWRVVVIFFYRAVRPKRDEADAESSLHCDTLP